MDRFQILKGLQPPKPVLPPEPEFKPLEFYRARQGEIHRVGLVFTDPKTMFLGSKVHYHSQSRKYFMCKTVSNRGEICCEKLGPSGWRMGSVLVKYSTNELGTPTKPFNYQVMPWIFGEVTFRDLKTLNDEFPLVEHDIKIQCTHEDYHLALMPCNESFWQAEEELKINIVRAYLSTREFIKKSLAADLGIPEIKALLHDTFPNS
jgi:hypothetical protein